MGAVEETGRGDLRAALRLLPLIQAAIGAIVLRVLVVRPGGAVTILLLTPTYGFR